MLNTSRRMLQRLAIAAIAPLFVAGCGSDDDGATTTQAAVAPATTGAAATTAAPATIGGTEETTGESASTATTGQTATSDAEASSDAALDQLIAAAQDEGSLVVYTSPSEVTMIPVFDAFTARYGIDVEFVRIGTRDMVVRFQAELDADSPSADVLIPGSLPFIEDSIAAGQMVALDDALGDAFPVEYPSDFVRGDGASAAIFVNLLGIYYNTDELDGDEPPVDWEDVLDPQWMGRIALLDPASSQTHAAFYNYLAGLYGDEFLSGLAAQDPVRYAEILPHTQAVGAGEAAVGLTGLSINVAQVGNPALQIAIPATTTGTEGLVGINADAVHPNAGRLFAEFMLSEQGATLLAATPGNISPYDRESLPADYSEVSLDLTEERIAEIRSLLGF